MYVCELDRPWTDTPFLFQGFYIEDIDTIDELRRYCEHVFVDVSRHDDTITPPLWAPPQKPARKTPRPNGSRVTATKTSSQDCNDATEQLKVDLRAARKAHEKAQDAVQHMYQRIGSGEDMEISGVKQIIDPIMSSVMRNDDAISWLVRMQRKNDYIYEHSIGSSVWAMMFGKHLGLDSNSLQVLGMGAMFLDVGKTKIPTELLIKQGTLTEAEQQTMRKHVDLGVQIVSRIVGVDPRVLAMVQSHHERHNGTGYPQGLAGADIPIFARIAGIVDTYDAMTSKRPYAGPKSTYDAMRQLHLLAGVEFAEEVVEQFVQAIGVFPVGSLVELNTGEVGIVIAQNRVRRLRPKIMILLDKNKNTLRDLPIIDLRNQLADASGEQSLWIEQGLAPGDYGIDPAEYYI